MANNHAMFASEVIDNSSEIIDNSPVNCARDNEPAEVAVDTRFDAGDAALRCVRMNDFLPGLRQWRRGHSCCIVLSAVRSPRRAAAGPSLRRSGHHWPEVDLD